MPGIPDFDVNGLWRDRGALFSRYGNLTRTLIELVRNSPGGLTAAEVGGLLSLRPISLMWAFRDHADLRREKHQGVYVYFDSGRARHTQQRQQRAAMSRAARRLSEFEAIAVLVEKIKHPKMSVVVSTCALPQPQGGNDMLR